jgi:hypothetical protein
MRPPGPRGHGLVGSLPELRRDALGFFAACARQYGDVVPIRVPRRRSRFSLAPGKAVTPMLSVTLRPAHGMFMVLSAR